MTGPLAGQTYTQVMLPMGAQNDQWIANIASYIRNDFGNSASFITPADVARVRSGTGNRKSMWTYPELEATLPRVLPPDPSWKATASHNPERAANGLTLAAWTTVVPQEPGMWFQVELPQAARITEVHFESGPPGRRRPTGRGAGRGGDGRGADGRAGEGRGVEGRGAEGERGGGRGGPPPFGSYPLGYQVHVSMDGRSWGTPIAKGKGTGTPTIITFRPVQAKYVRITQTEQAPNALPWSVLAFRVYAAGGVPQGPGGRQ
jgi:hypothetical protein